MLPELYLTPERITSLICLLMRHSDTHWIKALVALVEVEEESGLCLWRMGRVVDLTEFDDGFDAQGTDDRDFDLAWDEFITG